jgi:uncharacterized membrane protein
MAISSPGGSGSSTPTWLWVVLFTSLAINLLVAGVALGLGWRHHRGEGRGWDPGGPRANAGMELSPQRRQELRDSLSGVRQQLAARRDEMDQRRRAVSAVLDKEPFDKDAYVASMRSLIDLETKVRSDAQPMLADAAARMTPEERRSLFRPGHRLRRLLQQLR